MSNISQRKYYTAIAILFLAIIGVIPLAFKSKFTEDWAKNRVFYTADAPKLRLENDYYENLRNPNKPILNGLTIPSDVIETNFLKIFIGYPKRLDKELAKICKPDVFPDSLGKAEKEEREGENAITCLNSFYQLYVNDSLYQNDFIFYKHPITNELGLITYLPTQDFRKGKNMLRMIRNYVDSADRKSSERFLPFWYIPWFVSK